MTIEEVWNEYRTRIKSFLHARVSNPADVDDLLQEISIKTLAGFGNIEDQTKVQSWLFQIANRTIIDFYRKNGNARDIHSDDLWYAQDDPAVLSELERCIEPFLNALPPETGRLLYSDRHRRTVAEGICRRKRHILFNLEIPGAERQGGLACRV